ncbi:GrpB family protein [Streptomyces sp. NPDC056983]|uniref:GrpB family protein n=1 Tax=Streptomyces sp. NPDC056983 TaxID=3345987 RepID=UPI00362A15F1
MPSPDEIGPVMVLDHRPQWPPEFEQLAGQLRAAMGGVALDIDHVGSTAVPGLAAKDCIDVQIRVRSIDEGRDVALLSAIGFRCRREPWNRTEVSGGVPCRKLVFAPPVGARPCNIHLREGSGLNARCALLFRDYLRADEPARRAWGAFKQRPAASVSDLCEYGQIKAPATEVLMAGAERWAAETAWTVTRQSPPGSA